MCRLQWTRRPRRILTSRQAVAPVRHAEQVRVTSPHAIMVAGDNTHHFGATFPSLKPCGRLAIRCFQSASGVAGLDFAAMENPCAAGNCLISPDGAHIFVASPHGSLHAVLSDSGEQEWIHEFDVKRVTKLESSADCTSIYFGTGDRKLHAVCAATGAELWVAHLGSATARTLAISRDGAIIFCGGDNGELHALAASTGERKWVMPPGDAIAGDGSFVVSPDGRRLIVLRDGGQLTCVSTADGKTTWVHNAPDSAPSQIQNLLITPDCSTLLFTACNGDLQSLSLSSGQHRWTCSLGRNSIGGLQVSPDGALIFGGTEDGEVCAVSAVDGRKKWVLQLHGAQPGPLTISPDGSSIYFCTAGGNLHAVVASTGALRWVRDIRDRELASRLVTVSLDGTRAMFWTSSGFLCAIDTSTGDERWSYQFGTSVPAQQTFLETKDGSMAIIATANGRLHAFDPNSGQVCAEPLVNGLNAARSGGTANLQATRSPRTQETRSRFLRGKRYFVLGTLLTVVMLRRHGWLKLKSPEGDDEGSDGELVNVLGEPFARLAQELFPRERGTQ